MTEKRDTIMDKRLSQLKETQERLDRNNQISIPKIQRVPKFLRQNDRFAKYCTPKIISFGPIHHKNESLKEGEHYKLLWTSIFVADYGKKIDKDANEACKLLLKKIEDNIENVKNMFTEDAIEGYNDNDLVWILFVDGCSLIHFMENIDDGCPQALNLKYDQLMYMFRDAMLLENQLPRKMLEILCNEKGLDLIYCYRNYISMGEHKRQGNVAIPFEQSLPLHILDSVRSLYLTSNMDINEGNEHNQVGENTILNQDDFEEELYFSSAWKIYKNIRDLKKVGIKVMANKRDYSWSNISFKSKWFGGELRIPVLSFNKTTPYCFWNLIAYEMCPDVHYKYEICMFLTFMGSLVDNADDVKELRSAGVLCNFLGSEEELANLFNDLNDDMPTNMFHSGALYYRKKDAYTIKYDLIKHHIEKHYSNKWKISMAKVYYTHFKQPWSMIAFLAASLTLVLTFLQTWYGMKPK